MKKYVPDEEAYNELQDLMDKIEEKTEYERHTAIPIRAMEEIKVEGQFNEIDVLTKCVVLHNTYTPAENRQAILPFPENMDWVSTETLYMDYYLKLIGYYDPKDQFNPYDEMGANYLALLRRVGFINATEEPSRVDRYISYLFAIKKELYRLMLLDTVYKKKTVLSKEQIEGIKVSLFVEVVKYLI
jgi:hypothetical protein